MEDERKRLTEWYIERRTELAEFLDDLAWELVQATAAAAQDYYRTSDIDRTCGHADRLESLMILKRSTEVSLEAVNRAMETLSRTEDLNRLRTRRGK
jgi:hypothetical protein